MVLCNRLGLSSLLEVIANVWRLLGALIFKVGQDADGLTTSFGLFVHFCDVAEVVDVGFGCARLRL